jgi:hypothetical protein
MNLQRMHVADIFLLCIGLVMAAVALGFPLWSLTYEWGTAINIGVLGISAFFALLGLRLIYRVFTNPLPIIETPARPAYRQKARA